MTGERGGGEGACMFVYVSVYMRVCVHVCDEGRMRVRMYVCISRVPSKLVEVGHAVGHDEGLLQVDLALPMRVHAYGRPSARVFMRKHVCTPKGCRGKQSCAVTTICGNSVHNPYQDTPVQTGRASRSPNIS